MLGLLFLANPSVTALPDGIDDAVVNRTELATAMNVSVNTVDAWRRAGMPVLNEGSNGRSYEIQLSQAYVWRLERDREEKDRRTEAANAAAQLRLHFIGDDFAAKRSRLSPKEQKELAQAQLVYMQAARQRRELISTDEARDLIESLFSSFRDAMEALPDRLAREAGIDPGQTDKAVEVCDSTLRELGRQIAAAHLEPLALDEVVA